MDATKWVRDPTKIHNLLKESKDNLVASKPCKLYFPESTLKSNMGSIEEEIRIVGIFAIWMEGNYYGVSRTNAMITTEPSIINTVSFNDVPYMEFSYDPGDLIINNLNLIRTGTLVYRIYNSLIAGGKVPWFFTISDLCFLFDTAQMHGNANLGVNSAVLELIAGSMLRDSKDRSRFFRHVDDGKRTSEFIPLNSVALGVSNTSAAIMGNHHGVAFTSALVNESTRNESIEDLLRA